MRAERIQIESDEDGFHLLVWTSGDPRGKPLNFNIHSVAPELFEQVKRIIGGWIAEGEAVQQQYERYAREFERLNPGWRIAGRDWGREARDELTPYDWADPKSDEREGK